MTNGDSEKAVKKVTLASWEEFAAVITKKWLKDEAHIFRGQMDAQWKLESRLDRLERRFPCKPCYGDGKRESIDNRMSLFPDLDGAAHYVNALWELDFATPLGRVPDPT